MEIELLIFQIGDVKYAVTVDKVESLIDEKAVTDLVPVPNADTRVKGIFSQSGRMIPMIDLTKCFTGIKSSLVKGEYGAVAVCCFNNNTVAFPVDSVVLIDHVMKKDIVRPKTIITMAGTVTGFVCYNGDIVSLLDIEAILNDLNAKKMLPN